MPNSKNSILARERIAQGLTQEHLAARLGIARSTLSSVENGHVKPWPRLRADAAEVLGVTSETLFDDSLGSGTP